VLALAEAQHGLVAHRQLLGIGLSPARIGRWVERRRLVRVRRGVYALGHRQRTDRARWQAATLARGPASMLGGLSASSHWDLRINDGGETTVYVMGTGSRVKYAGEKVVRVSDLSTTECTRHCGIPVVGVARTLVELAGVVPAAKLRRAVERAEQLELFDGNQVWPIIERRRGWPGVAALERLLLDAQAHGLPKTRSDLEAEFIEFCIAHALPRPQVNRYDGTQEVDFRWPSHKLVVETDGWQFHRTRAAFERDALRTQRLASEGWTVVRITWRQVHRDPRGVAQRLRSALAR